MATEVPKYHLQYCDFSVIQIFILGLVTSKYGSRWGIGPHFSELIIKSLNVWRACNIMYCKAPTPLQPLCSYTRSHLIHTLAHTCNWFDCSPGSPHYTPRPLSFVWKAFTFLFFHPYKPPACTVDLSCLLTDNSDRKLLHIITLLKSQFTRPGKLFSGGCQG